MARMVPSDIAGLTGYRSCDQDEGPSQVCRERQEGHPCQGVHQWLNENVSQEVSNTRKPLRTPPLTPDSNAAWYVGAKKWRLNSGASTASPKASLAGMRLTEWRSAQPIAPHSWNGLSFGHRPHEAWTSHQGHGPSQIYRQGTEDHHNKGATPMSEAHTV
jgi:hypothetical protein